MKPSILVARAIFPEVLEQLEQVFNVDHNQDDVVMTPAELLRGFVLPVGTVLS